MSFSLIRICNATKDADRKGNDTTISIYIHSHSLTDDLKAERHSNPRSQTPPSGDQVGIEGR